MSNIKKKNKNEKQKENTHRRVAADVIRNSRQGQVNLFL
jgi:hypothetical protein